LAYNRVIVGLNLTGTDDREPVVLPPTAGRLDMNPSEDHDTTELSDSLEKLRRKTLTRWDELTDITPSRAGRDAVKPGDAERPPTTEAR
jgi:hypothetical protein